MVLSIFDGVWRKEATDITVSYLESSDRPHHAHTLTTSPNGLHICALEKCSAHNAVTTPDTYLCPTENQFKEDDNDVAGNNWNLEVLYRIVEVDSLHYQWRLRVWIWRVPTVFGEEPRPVDDQSCICEQ